MSFHLRAAYPRYVTHSFSLSFRFALFPLSFPCPSHIWLSCVAKKSDYSVFDSKLSRPNYPQQSKQWAEEERKSEKQWEKSGVQLFSLCLTHLLSRCVTTRGQSWKNLWGSVCVEKERKKNSIQLSSRTNSMLDNKECPGHWMLWSLVYGFRSVCSGEEERRSSHFSFSRAKEMLHKATASP